MYYSFAVTPWFFVTGDLEYIAPPRKPVENAFDRRASGEHQVLAGDASAEEEEMTDEC